MIRRNFGSSARVPGDQTLFGQDFRLLVNDEILVGVLPGLPEVFGLRTRVLASTSTPAPPDRQGAAHIDAATINGVGPESTAA